ncbi:hypothetical protein CHISP_2943 [Chitinispirillum alkaliphilum]|nr:hypothetical protein CHISP_2943 [Chitinispirillum alkaliphilum]
MKKNQIVIKIIAVWLIIVQSLYASHLKPQAVSGALEAGNKEVVYRSALPDEVLFQVRVSVSPDDHLTYLFLGSVIPIDSADTGHYMRIYEYIPGKKVHIVDSMPVMPFNSIWTMEENGVYFEHMLLRNYDNLHLSGDTLFYYQEITYPEYDHQTDVKFTYDREYFMYVIGSEQNPIQTDEVRFRKSNRRLSVHSLENVAISPNGNYTSRNNMYNISFLLTSDYTEDEIMQSFKTKEVFALPKFTTGYDLITYFPGFEEMEQPCNDEYALFGGMDWHPDGDVLFFDNSGICYACIWMFDLKSKEVKKLVADHEAIHPFYYEKKGQQYLAYVQENEVRRYSLGPINSQK